MECMFKAHVANKLESIPDDEPLFLLRGQDLLAPAAVEFWATLVQNCMGDDGQAEHATAHAQAMREWSPRKMPD